MPTVLTPTILTTTHALPALAGRTRVPSSPRRVAPARPVRSEGGRPPSRDHAPIQNHATIRNRIRVLLVHIPFLSIRGQARLAADIGVSRSTVSRLVGGRINPSYRLARAVTDALERRMARPLDIRDVFSADGTYPTPSGCQLCRCGGCLPDEAYDPEGALRPEWRDARPGDWSQTPPPHSYSAPASDTCIPSQSDTCASSHQS